MKCKVLRCRYNDGDCSIKEEVEIIESGSGMHCSSYEEKKSIRLSKFKILQVDVGYGEELVVMLLTYESLHGVFSDIQEELNSKYGLKYKTVIFDRTCCFGTKSSERYVRFIMQDGKLEEASPIDNAKELNELKLLTCGEFLKNPSSMASSVLLTAQRKMILKGIVI